MTDIKISDAVPEERSDGGFTGSGFVESPLRYLLMTIFCMFVVELTIMLMMERLSPLPLYQRALIDAILLTVLLVPVLYFFVLKPMQRYVMNQHSLEKMIFEIEEREHRRIGQKLHDSLGQILTGIAFQSKVLERRLEKILPEEADSLAQITTHVNAAANEARLLAHDLRSIGTEEDSLIFALNDLASLTKRAYTAECKFFHDDDISISNKAAVTHLYRIAQEAVTNAAKHGSPSYIEINLSRNGHYISLTVGDDGKGFDTLLRQYRGMGMRVMSYRARSISASLDIHSKPGSGTRVTCTLYDEGLER